MARKRNTESDTRLTGAAAPAREKFKTSRTKHAVKSTPETVLETIAAPESEQETVQPSEVTAPQFTPAYQFTPSNDEISALAYSYWVERGYQGGCPEEDWFRAETELRERR